MLVQSLEKLKDKKLSQKTVIAAGRQGFYDKASPVVESLLQTGNKPTVIVLPDLKVYRKFLESVNQDHYQLFPPLDVLPFEPVEASFSTLRSRMKTLLNDGSDVRPVV